VSALGWISRTDIEYKKIKDSYKIDAYERFVDSFGGKEKFFEFGLNEAIFVDDQVVAENWEILKNSIKNKDEIFIRGFGRNANGTDLFLKFYQVIFGFQEGKVKKDPTNNQKPTSLIQTWTGLKKNKEIYNYQVSHIFGRTKNIYAFTAPWNIVFMPKILDPFTGHEAKGPMIIEFQHKFKQLSYERFEPYIKEFNQIVTDEKLIKKRTIYFQKLREDRGLNESLIKKFESAVEAEFDPIKI
jgi:hypothetical protein